MRRWGSASLCGAVLLAVCLSASVAGAQEWSAAQKDVWKSVEAYWALDAAGDLEGFMSYFHADYVGWSYDNPLPGNKATVRKFIDHEYKTGKTMVYDVKPAAIQVMGSFAFAHYYYSRVTKGADGKEESSQGRWTDILTKQGDRWVLIGDHGGRTKKN